MPMCFVSCASFIVIISYVNFFQTILSYMGEEKLQTFINFALKCLSEIKLPAKRGNFIEFRTGLLNVCPVGRSCSQEERDAFGEYDKVHNIRGKLVESFKKEFPDFGLTYVIGKLIKSVINLLFNFEAVALGKPQSYYLTIFLVSV